MGGRKWMKPGRQGGTGCVRANVRRSVGASLSCVVQMMEATSRFFPCLSTLGGGKTKKYDSCEWLRL